MLYIYIYIQYIQYIYYIYIQYIYIYIHSIYIYIYIYIYIFNIYSRKKQGQIVVENISIHFKTNSQVIININEQDNSDH